MSRLASGRDRIYTLSKETVPPFSYLCLALGSTSLLFCLPTNRVGAAPRRYISFFFFCSLFDFLLLPPPLSDSLRSAFPIPRKDLLRRWNESLPKVDVFFPLPFPACFSSFSRSFPLSSSPFACNPATCAVSFADGAQMRRFRSLASPLEPSTSNLGVRPFVCL